MRTIEIDDMKQKEHKICHRKCSVAMDGRCGQKRHSTGRETHEAEGGGCAYLEGRAHVDIWNSIAVWEVGM